MDRQLVVPGLARHHVGDLDVAPLEFPGGRVDEPVLLGLMLDGLGVEEDVEFQMASLLKLPLMIGYLKLAEKQPAILEQRVTGLEARRAWRGPDLRGRCRNGSRSAGLRSR